MKTYDIAVIGGGASGLMAAVSAAAECRRLSKPASIAVLEKNARAGKKILMTGNGRCNLTNTGVNVKAYRGDTGLLKPVLNKYPAERVVDIFKSMGLLCRETDGGRVYPYNMQASSVLNILLRRMESYGVEMVCGFDVDGVKKSGDGFTVSSQDGSVAAKKLIFAFGGMACPQSGSDGKCFSVLKPLGHKTTKLFPSLVQVKTDLKLVRPLKGVRSLAEASFCAGGKRVKSEKGEVQFTESGLSGICVFDLARLAGEYGNETKPYISLDLMPEYTRDDIAAFLQKECYEMPELPAGRLADGFLNKALGTEVIKRAVSDVSAPAGKLTADGIRRAAGTVKGLDFPVDGTLSWDKAQVTAGGVPLREVNADMSSKACGGGYLCGELLNVDGICGGYNLHWAFASGDMAGRSAARGL